MTVGEMLVVLERGREPVGRTLEHQHLCRFLGDDRYELCSAGAGADHGDAFAGEVRIVVPTCGVEGGTAKRLAASDVGEVRPIELTRGIDDCVEGIEPGLIAGA